jgi:hypothetical protein
MSENLVQSHVVQTIAANCAAVLAIGFFARTEFSARRLPVLLFLLAVVVLGIGTLAYIWPSRVGGIADGRIRESLTFVIVDKDTQLPIKGAQVRIRDLANTGDEIPRSVLRDNEAGTGGVSDADGTVMLSYSFPLSVHWDSSSRNETVSFPDSIWLDVSSDRHQRRTVVLRELVGRTRETREFPFAAIRIAMSNI